MPQVLGIGNPCIDHIFIVSEEFLASLPVPCEGMVYVSQGTFQKILKESHSIPIEILGGSALNTLRGLAALGHSCALWGKVGEDAEGTAVEQALRDHKMTPFLNRSKSSTTQIAVLVTPGGKRTFCTYYGAGAEMNAKDFKEAFLEGVELVHIEGYLLSNSHFVETMIKKIKEKGIRVSFDLGNFNLVRQHRSRILPILQLGVDLLFADAQEVAVLTGKETPEEGCRFLLSHVPLNVVSAGVEGCWVGEKGALHHYPAYPVPAIDSTGAGDLFACGFLHGWLQGASLEKGAHYGALLGAAVVQYYGAEIPERHWQELRESLCRSDG